jgi:hypothetical protein
MEEMSLKQLQAEAVKLGMPQADAELLGTKKAIIGVINTLKATKAEQERVESLEERPDPAEEKQVNRAFMAKAEAMRKKLESMPKVRFFLPISGGEKPGVVREVVVKGRKEQVHVSGAIEVVQLNGYKTIIPKGQFVEIPQQVAEVLSESMQATQQAGADFLIDRIDPKTGKQVGEQL